MLLLEKRNGQIATIAVDSIQSEEKIDEAWTPLSPEELADELLLQLGAAFAIHQTEHFVICSDASERYTDYCGRLLEKVHDEFIRFVKNGDLETDADLRPLPVIIFGQVGAFQEHAAKQHPETDFSDTPGYYSIRDNQMLIASLSGDRNFRTNSDVLRELRKKPRQVETIVHEAIHQLSFNSGLQKRYADNPIWLSEGLAVYFEQSSVRSGLIWSRPGNVNRIHFPGFQRSLSGGRLKLSLTDLVSTDTAFLSSENLAEAYATSWALTHFLIRTDREAYDSIVKRFQNQTPLKPFGAERRIKAVEAATEKSITELEDDLIRYVGRLRIR